MSRRSCYLLTKIVNPFMRIVTKKAKSRVISGFWLFYVESRSGYFDSIFSNFSQKHSIVEFSFN